MATKQDSVSKKEKQNNNSIEKSKLYLAEIVLPVSAKVVARPQLMYQPPACSFRWCLLNTCMCPHTQSLLWITRHIMSYEVFFLGRFCNPDHSSSRPVRMSFFCLHCKPQPFNSHLLCGRHHPLPWSESPLLQYSLSPFPPFSIYT